MIDMLQSDSSLIAVFDGWSGYNQSIINAVELLTPELLRWRPAEKLYSIGELVRHISLGRMIWFMRMDAPGSAEATSHISEWEQDSDGNRVILEESIAITEQPQELIRWLNLTWQMIEITINSWNIDDLSQTYPHRWIGKTYAVSRQWTIWRVMSHDIHHGGELSLMLGMKGIQAFELSDLFGHIVLPPLLNE
jgi:uncharacterized damage-inducible protein DinB